MREPRQAVDATGRIDGEVTVDALETGQREIAEELDAGISQARRIFGTAHPYPERVVELHFYRVELTGEPQPALGQELRWIGRDELGVLQFPPADAELIDGLMNTGL